MPVSKKIKSNKNEKFDVVCKALFSLLEQHGPFKVTHSLVSKKANVSRAWLYKYIGSNKEDLIRFAIDHFAAMLIQNDMNQDIRTKDDLLQIICHGINRTFDHTQTYPWFIPVYFKYRGTPTAPGRSIADAEQAYVKRQARHFESIFSYPKKNALMTSEILTALRMGLAFSWQKGDLKQKASQTEVMASITHWLHELFHA